MIKSPINRLSIQWKLPLALCALLLFVVATLSWVAHRRFSDSLVQSAGDRLQLLAREYVSGVQDEARGTIAAVLPRAREAAVIEKLRNPNSHPRTRLAEAIQYRGSGSERVVATELRRLDGSSVFAVGPAIAGAVLPVFDLAKAVPGDQPGGVGPFFVVGDTALLPAIAAVESNGERVGYVIDWWNIQQSPEAHASWRRTQGNDAAVLLGSAGGAWTDRLRPVSAPPLNDPGDPEQILRYDRDDAGTRLATLAQVRGTPWLVAFEFAESAVLAPARRFLRDILIIATLIALFGFVSVSVLTLRITRPLRQLTSLSEAISLNEYSHRIQVHGNDEIALLGGAFNRMAEHLQSTHGELERKVEELGTVQRQFIQAQRMEAVGRLAGGVAHDFNNLLTVILAESQFASEENSGEARAESIESIRSAANRAATLTRQLLTFSRGQLVEPTIFNLNDLVTELERMLGRLIGEDIRLLISLGAAKPTVRADRGQIEQVIVNLVVNSRDAMPHGGNLSIATENIDLDEDYTSNQPDVTPGAYVMVAVSDTGSGMSDEVRAKIFEPFFTTKELGRGTGLGLATCYGIVKQAGGHIVAYSEPGLGTTMRFYLPNAAHEVDQHPAEDQATFSGNETILLVEDDAAVRLVAQRMLQRQGYRVIAAGSGEEAVTYLEQHGETIDLLLTDVVLPGIGGRELAERATRIRSGIKVLFASGYTDDVTLQHQLIAHEVAIVQKPFTQELLGRRVRQVLDQS